MRKYKKILGSVAVVGALLAGGSAFTASNSVPMIGTMGYASQEISGVTATSVVYNTSLGGSLLDSITLVLWGDTLALDIAVSFSSGELPQTCSGSASATWEAGGEAGHTTYSCDVGLPVALFNRFTLVATGPAL